MGLKQYQSKRDFQQTPEPRGRLAKAARRRFVVQEHHASSLHFDFRLEIDGVLKSWAVPKGPTLDPREKRLAVMTEDHPVEYLKFEGRIPEGHYGAGEQLIWDTGTYELLNDEAPGSQLKQGKVSFRLNGRKLKGEFNLIEMKGRGEKQWLLMKGNDEFAEPSWKLELLLKKGKTTGKASRDSRSGRAAKKSPVKAETQGGVFSADNAFKGKELKGNVQVSVGNHVLSLTNLNKVYWPDDGYTKGDLIRYYYDVSEYILPHLKDRPLILKRYPNGIDKPSFHQHDVDAPPDFVRTISIAARDGHMVDYILTNNVETLVYVANLGSIECHPWHSRARDLDRPDWCVFDLDPSKDVSFAAICDLSLRLKTMLEQIGLESFAKTSGSRGMHVYVPFKPAHSSEDVARFAERIASALSRENPGIATVERSLKKRPLQSIYVDHQQNARGKSVAAAYSVRPRPGATVSAPLEWAEVKRGKITPEDFTIKNMLDRIQKKGDLFSPVLAPTQKLPVKS